MTAGTVLFAELAGFRILTGRQRRTRTCGYRTQNICRQLPVQRLQYFTSALFTAFGNGTLSAILSFMRTLILLVSAGILVICQELFEEDFDMFFRKKGNFNRPSVYFTYNRMSVRLNIIFGVQLFAGVQLVFDQQSKNESY